MGDVVNSTWKKAAIVCVAALAAVATLAEASSSGDANTSTAASADPSSDAALPEPGIGDEARDGKFGFTVTKVKCGVKKVGTELLNEKAQGQFCLVTMTITNVGDEAQTFDAGSQKARTSSGATVNASTAASIYANEESNVFLEQINPGNSLVDVVVAYDIAKDQDLVKLELHDSIFSDGVLVSVD